MFGCLLGWYTIYTFLGAFAPDVILLRVKLTLRPSLAFSYIGSITTRHSSSGPQPNFGAWYQVQGMELRNFRRGRHLYLAVWPSRWASAHIYDYVWSVDCNSLLRGISQRNFDHLQRVQNSLARVVTQAPRRSSATDLWRQLHWLPILQSVSFKLVTITFRAIHTGTPIYLAYELHRHQPLRALRSGTTTTLKL